MIIENEIVSRPEKIAVAFPATGEQIGEVTKSDDADVDRAVESAQSAFIGPVRQLTPFERSRILHRVHDALSKNRQDLAKQITLESGKILRESSIEIDRALTTLRFSAEEATRLHGEVLPCDVTAAKTGKNAYVHREPIGVVGAITPFNFPLNTVVHKVAPAIAAGNTVVLKPSPETPLTSEMLGLLFAEAGAPPGMLNVVQGASEVGERLVGHPLVRAITFTGSIATGQRVSRIAGMKKLILELGGNDPLIVFPDADIEAAAATAIEQGLGTTGQRCTAVKRLFIHEKVFDKFTDMLCPKVRNLQIGDPLDASVDMGPLISEKAALEIEQRVHDAAERGAKLLVTGFREGAFHPPVVLTDVPEDCRLVAEETFGPVLPLKQFVTVEECIRMVNSTPYGLQAGVYTDSLELVKQLRRELEVGTLVVNGGPGFRIDSLPFGGVKQSGLGREGVIASVRELTEERVLIL